MKQRGFTLIELLVAGAIFATIVVVVVGVFTAAIKLQSQVLSAKKVIGETNYVLEFMSRNLRMAVKESTRTPACLSESYMNYELFQSKTWIKFRNVFENLVCQDIYLDPLTKQIMFVKVPGAEAVAITSPKIQVEKLQFFVSGNDDGDNLQPMVTVYMEVKSGNAPLMRVQTSVSQRNLDAN